MNLFHIIYCMPLSRIIGIMAFCVFAWAMACTSQKHSLKILNALIFLASIGAILYTTLFTRSEGSNSQLVLTPFASFAEAKIQPELYRSMLMNCFLFFPIGISLPFALPHKWKGKPLLTVLFAFALSAGIESLQYRYGLGRAEVDDVICNTFGAMLGVCAYFLSVQLSKIGSR